MTTFLQLALKVLQEAKTPLSSEEIWEYAKSKGYDVDVGTQGKTPWKTISAIIYVNIRDKSNSPFKITETRPKKFYLKAWSKEFDVSKATEEKPSIVPIPKKKEYLEKDLHPFLSYYAFYYMKTCVKTIQHTKSDKKEFGEWVHPDMVGCYFPLEEWNPEVIDFSYQIRNVAIKLYSFEIKRELTFTNLREAFFQTVSNSTWANESYLVAAQIQNDEEFLDELKRLSGSFGIGIIKLNIDDPDSSEIMLPAKIKEYLDWDTINKLTMNPDFKEFIKRIKTDIQSKEVRKEKYDKVLDKEVLVQTLKV